MSERYADLPSLEATYREHHGQVYRYLLRKTGSHVEAEELTQRVFLDAAAALSRVRPTSMLAWLYTVAERRFIDELRRRRRRREVPLPDENDEALFDAEVVYGPEIARAIGEAIGVLPEEQRVVVTMRLFEDRVFAEIGELVGASEAACKMRFTRGLERVREELDRKGIGP